MKLLLLGASGRTGRLIFHKALNDGHQVVAIVRDPARFAELFNFQEKELPIVSPLTSHVSPPAKTTIIEGSPYYTETIEKAMPGCEAVICALNISRRSENPWAKLRAPKDLISRSIQNALAAMQKNDVSRLVTLSVLGIGDMQHQAPFLFNQIVAITNLRFAYYDHDRQEKLLAASGINWTSVRLPVLTNKAGEFPVLVDNGEGIKLKTHINRESVARFVLSILENPVYFQKRVGISCV